MIIKKSSKKDCKDVFNSFLVKDAEFDGIYEIPKIKTSSFLPNKVIPFSKISKAKDYDQWVVFYENDYKFEKLWRNPKKYLKLLSKFKGVISPDFSLYVDMPFALQINSTYKGKALANFFIHNGIQVIPNIRWSDERTFDLACAGIEKNKTIAIGTHGCIKTKEEKQLFIKGFDYVVKKLTPKNIVVYGRAPDKIFCLAKFFGINIFHFESYFALFHTKNSKNCDFSRICGLNKRYKNSRLS